MAKPCKDYCLMVSQPRILIQLKKIIPFVDLQWFQMQCLGVIQAYNSMSGLLRVGSGSQVDYNFTLETSIPLDANSQILSLKHPNTCSWTLRGTLEDVQRRFQYKRRLSPLLWVSILQLLMTRTCILIFKIRSLHKIGAKFQKVVLLWEEKCWSFV